MSNSPQPEDLSKGHRQRLRTRFIQDPTSFREVDILELLLTYAIPRIDVSPLASSLLQQFGSMEAVFSAQPADLAVVPGLGEQSITFLKVLENIRMTKNQQNQPALFQDLPAPESRPHDPRPKRVFTDDETENSIRFLPEVVNFSSTDAYKSYLKDNLPYNSEVTRARRMNYIMHRFLPDDSLDIPLVYFLSRSKSSKSIESLVFYEILKIEPLPQRIAEELIFPNLPLGFVRRSQIEEFIRSQEPDLVSKSVSKAVGAVINLYKDASAALFEGNRLTFHLHTSDFGSFLYVFTSVFDHPGMFSFDELFHSPLHRWMLWDRDWLRRQLYNLRDMGILSKISEIDRINQFTLAFTRMEALKHYFDDPANAQKAIRDGESQSRNYGE